MTTIKVDTITNAAGTGAPNIPDGVTIAGTALASANTMDYTASASEPTSPKNGAIWWDTGNDKFFQYMNGAWIEVSYTDLPARYGDRGVFGGGDLGTKLNVIDYVSISTPGNATDFGDLSTIRNGLAACSDATYGLFGGGTDGTRTNIIEYITFATTGNTTDFGDLTVARNGLAACSDGTYGLFGGGFDGTRSTIIDYITIATTGNAIDFGDLTLGRSGLAGASNATYGLFGGGFSGVSNSNVIDYVTIQVPGNATDFGDLTSSRSSIAAVSDDTYAVFFGSSAADYVSINTPGNASTFTSITNWNNTSGCSNGSRGLFGGGYYDVGIYDTIHYITISVPSSTTDFGDLTTGRQYLAACSGD